MKKKPLQYYVVFSLLIFFQFCSSLSAFQGKFSNGSLEKISYIHLNEISSDQYVDSKAVFCDNLYFSGAWGHAVQDTIAPIFVYLKNHNLLDKEIIICIKTYNSDSKVQKNAQQFVKDIFPHADLRILTDNSSTLYFEDIEIINSGVPLPNLGQHMAQMRSYGFAKNVRVPPSIPEETPIIEFIDHVLKCYGLEDLEFTPKRAYIIRKGEQYSRRILNLDQVTEHFKRAGYEVVDFDFEKLSPKEQVIAARSCEYYISTHGAALTNTMFLHKDAKVVIIWPEDAKLFHNRVYCPFTSILFSKGVEIIEYDKPYYPWDQYGQLNEIMAPSYFYKDKNRVRLRPEKKNWEDIFCFPLACMYDIYNVNMFLLPNDLISKLEN